MGKTSLGMVAHFVPDGVDRYVACPGLPLHDLVLRRFARRSGESPAVVGPEGTLTYKQLDALADRAAAALSKATPDGSRLVLSVDEPSKAVPLLFAALRSNRPVLLATEGALANAELPRLIRMFGAVALVRDRVVSTPTAGVGLLGAGDLLGGPEAPGPPKASTRLNDPAIALVAEDSSISLHSNKTLVAMAVSISNFFRIKANDSFVSLLPLSTWEGLGSLMGTLCAGGTWVSPKDDPALIRDLAAQDRSGLFIHRYQRAEEEMHRWQPVMTEWRGLRGVLVSVERAFQPSVRTTLASWLEKPVLTIYGKPWAGPILSAHPQWYIDHAIGTPVTNVDVLPLHPESHERLKVPWESLDYAELGVKSPMVGLALTATGPSPQPELSPTGQLAMMDPVGLFYLLRSPKG